MKYLLIILVVIISLLMPGQVRAQVESVSVSPQDDPSVLQDPAPAPVLETAVFQLRFVRPQVVADKVRDLMGAASGGVIVNDKSSELEISAPAETMEKIKALIAEIDMARDIVMDVKVVQVDLNEEHLPGINWSAIVSDYKSFAAHEENRKYSIGTVSSEDLPVLLEALQTVGETKVYPVHSARVSVTQDVDLRLKAFDRDVSVIVAPVVALTDHINPPEQQDRYTARLLLSPTASGSDMIDLRVISPDGSAITLNIKANAVAVIGGIFTQTKSESTKKFPFLGDVPLLGIVFRDQRTVVQRLENIMIVTPRVSAPLVKP